MLKTRKCIEFKGTKLKEFFSVLGHFKRSNTFNNNETIRKVYVMDSGRSIIQTEDKNVYVGRKIRNTIQIGDHKVAI